MLQFMPRAAVIFYTLGVIFILFFCIEITRWLAKAIKNVVHVTFDNNLYIFCS